ncbi:hypothetical protein [Phenylobacterium sp.]|uniref:hypothetical protein n=1 Tax=Phenylobacterium sp. TaxID=1871053 RepID=UPI0035AE4D7C
MPATVPPGDAQPALQGGPPTYPALHALDLMTRKMVEETALEEIETFRAWGDPAAIERLAEAGRLQDWGGDEGVALAWQVSDVLDEIAARLRADRRPAPASPRQASGAAPRWR